MIEFRLIYSLALLVLVLSPAIIGSASASVQTQLAIAISPNPVTEPSTATISATLLNDNNGAIKGDTVYIQQARDSSNNPTSCALSTSFANVYNAKTNNQGKITYSFATTNLGGKTIGYSANHPATKANAASTSSCQDLVVKPPTLPTVTILQPNVGQVLTTSSLLVSGSATAGGYPLSAVYVSLDGGSQVQATGTTSWSQAFNGLANGPHTVAAQAKDN